MNDENLNKQELMKKIMEYKFAVNDISLFLDTNPCNKKAINKHTEYVKNYKKYKEKYEKEYGPLCIYSEIDSWEKWVYEPWPWERSAN